MNRLPADHSFDIHTAADFFDKLQQEYQDFVDDPLSSRHAINCALTAWHLIDWTWAGHKEVVRGLEPSIKTKHEFVRYVISQCPELAIMQCIANGSKHFQQSRSKVKSTRLHGGAFSRGFSRGFNISTLDVVLDDGSTVTFDDIAETVVEYWSSFFNTHFRPPAAP
jgi:hypothetical protein